MGAGLIRIILTGLDFDVLLPITDITGRQAYFSLITSNSYGLYRLATPELCVRVCERVYVVKRVFVVLYKKATWPNDIHCMPCVCVYECADVHLSQVK